MIDTIAKAIAEDYHLKREDRVWRFIQEKTKTREKTEIRFKSPSRHSIGFSLDRKELRPLAFFSENPPAGLARMCDAFIFLRHKERIYILIIECKTGNKTGFTKQLVNGKYFCEWLVALCRRHKYLEGDPVYASLLVWQPREEPALREPTSHDSSPFYPVEKRSEELGDHQFEARNLADIPLLKLIESISKQG